MTQQSTLRRMGWIAALAICTALYLMLHLKVHAVRSEVIRAERQIVALEQQKLLLETEFETRASQRQLAAWNNVDFGYAAPTARQFLDNERQLASFGTPRAPGSPEPIRVAGLSGGEPEFPRPERPRMVSPLTGAPIDPALLEPEAAGHLASARASAAGRMRIELGAVIASAAQ
jgi:hypothetical protein